MHSNIKTFVSICSLKSIIAPNVVWQNFSVSTYVKMDHLYMYMHWILERNEREKKTTPISNGNAKRSWCAHMFEMFEYFWDLENRKSFVCLVFLSFSLSLQICVFLRCVDYTFVGCFMYLKCSFHLLFFLSLSRWLKTLNKCVHAVRIRFSFSP